MQMPPTSAIKFMVRTGKILGPGIAKLKEFQGSKTLADAASAAKNISSSQIGAVLDGVNEILQNVEPETALEYVVDCVCLARCEGEPMQKELVDIHFKDDVGEMFKVMRMVLEVNFKSFLPRLGVSQQTPEDNPE